MAAPPDVDHSIHESDKSITFDEISSVPYKKHHESKTKKLLPGSCKWLLEKSAFLDWKASSTSSILWLHGIPGCGKTMLMSHIIDMYFNASALDFNSAQIAFFYCVRDAAEPERADPDEIFRCILRQLSLNNSQIIERLITRQNEIKPDGFISSLKCSESVEWILEFLHDKPTTIILDALDECNPIDRQIMLSALEDLIERSRSLLKIFISSRDDQDIVDRLKEVPSVPVTVKDNKHDIEGYVNSEIVKAIEQERLLCGRVSYETKAYIIRTLISQARGMFRLASLHIETLCNSQIIKTEADVYVALKKLPSKLHESYDLLLEQISNYEPSKREIAIVTLKWLMCCRTQLPTWTLLDVHRMDSADPTVEITTPAVLSLCCNLVVMDSEQDIFRLAHLTVREYLENLWGTSASHAIVFERCIHSFFKDEYIDHSNPAMPKAKLNKIYWYSARYAPVHQNLARSGFTHYPISETLRRWLRHYFFESISFPKWIAKKRNCYHFSLFDWRGTVEYLLNEALKGELQTFVHDGKISTDQDTRMHAELMDLLFDQSFWRERAFTDLVPRFARLGLDELTLFMVRMGAGINSRDSHHKRALTYAIEGRKDHMVLELLQQGANCLKRDSDGMPEIHIASRIGYDFAIEQCLKSGASVDTSNSRNETPLMIAASNGQSSTVRLLLSRLPDIQRRNYLGDNCLHLAATKGDQDTVKLIIAADLTIVDIPDHLQRTPLHLSAAAGNIEALSILLNVGADSSRSNRDGDLPIQLAAKSGRTSSAMLLLMYERDADIRLERATKALHTAIDHGHLDLVRELFPAHVHLSTLDVCSMLFRFNDEIHIEYSNEITEYLLRSIQSVDSPDNTGETILHKAAKCSSLCIIRILIQIGVNLEVENTYGQTPLQIVAEKGNEVAVRILLDAGANPEAKIPVTGYTALHSAAEAGYLNVVKTLVSGGADFNAELSDGRTALHLAAENNFDSVVGLLLELM